MSANNNQTAKSRYPKGIVAPVIINYISPKNPNMLMWWSAALPGFGHILLCKLVQGGLLIIWEFVTNYKCHLNLAIFYSLTGQFERAKQVLDTRWFLLYIPVYLFGIWDVRRCTIDLNKYALLAQRSGSIVEPIRISTFEVEFLERKNPWTATLWSLLFPSLGQIYLGRLAVGFFVLVVWIVVCYEADVAEAIHQTFYGHFQQAMNVLNVQWGLFVASIYGYSAYDAYSNAIEYSKLFKNQQEKYLQETYDQKGYLQTGGNPRSMHVVASFEHSLFLELALTDLELKGIPKTDIQALPLAKKPIGKSTSSIVRGNGFSLLDGSFALGTACMVLGGIYGFLLEWGPIIWGLIGAVVGAGAGFLLEYAVHHKKLRNRGDRGTEVFVLVRCEKQQAQMVEDVFLEHLALGIARMD